MKLFFPDSLWEANHISGSSFLYFHSEKILFSLHPSATFFLSGVDPFSFVPFLEAKSPPWKDSFLRFLSTWREGRTSLRAAQDLIEPLRHKAFKTAILSYDRGSDAWQASDALLQSSTLDLHEIAPLINPMHACDEFFSHLFFDKVLEARYGNMPTAAQLDAMRQAAAPIDVAPDLIADFDWTPIYDYCDELFTHRTLADLLAHAYMFRLPALNSASALLLSNPNLPMLLCSLPASASDNESLDVDSRMDAIAWEFFRQLVSPVVDPLDAPRVALLTEMINARAEEIERLKNKCYDLSTTFSDMTDPQAVASSVRDVIRARVATELQDLLRIDKRATGNLLAEILGDEKTWMAVSSFIVSLLMGGELLTAGAAIYAMSRVGSKAVKEAADRRTKLSNSSYTLIYRMSH